MSTIKDYISERMKTSLHAVLKEQAARFVHDPRNYLDIRQNKFYDDISLGLVHASGAKEALNFEYSEIKFGCCDFGYPAVYFFTEKGIYRYQCYAGKSNQLRKVDEVLTQKLRAERSSKNK